MFYKGRDSISSAATPSRADHGFLYPPFTFRRLSSHQSSWEHGLRYPGSNTGPLERCHLLLLGPITSSTADHHPAVASRTHSLTPTTASSTALYSTTEHYLPNDTMTSLLDSAHPNQTGKSFFSPSEPIYSLANAGNSHTTV